MAGKIPRQFIDDLIARIDIVDLIDARIPLKKAGVNYIARCPFHTEKTPSFNVNRDKQFYHCFGCGAHGNAIGFLMDYERQTFVEAVETLAESLGVEVPREAGYADGSARPPAQAAALYALQEQVALFYARQLREHPEAKRAETYLAGRGVGGEVAKRYLLGYAPPGWRSLPASVPVEALREAGLVITRDQGGFYDRFRDRVMFPIRDRRGRVVGFGGRVLGDETPKYLNSPETPVFKKHLEVYGLHELLQAVRRPERILVVEGYLDVIALAQHDVPYAVATLGTSTSGEHVELLFRYARELVFCFDGDNAGRAAAWKALEASLPVLREGRSIGFLLLPQGHDPDTLIREEGRGRFEQRIEQRQPLSDYFFRHLTEKLDLRTLEGRAALLRDARPLIEKMPPSSFRELMAAHLDELSGQAKVNSAASSTPRRPARPVTTHRAKPSALRTLLALLVQHPGLHRLIDTETRACIVSDWKAGDLASKLFAILDERPGIATGGILEHFRNEPEEAQIKALSVWETLVPEGGEDAEFSDALKQCRRQRRDARLEALFVKDRERTLEPEEREELRRLLSER
jgi:DNA primase